MSKLSRISRHSLLTGSVFISAWSVIFCSIAIFCPSIILATEAGENQFQHFALFFGFSPSSYSIVFASLYGISNFTAFFSDLLMAYMLSFVYLYLAYAVKNAKSVFPYTAMIIVLALDLLIIINSMIFITYGYEFNILLKLLIILFRTVLIASASYNIYYLKHPKR